MILQDYQSFKLVVIELLDLSRDAIHIHVGFIALIFWLVVFKKRLDQWAALTLPLALSLMMEIMDLAGDYLIRSRLDVVGSLHDLINTNFIPVVLVAWARYQNPSALVERNSQE